MAYKGENLRLQLIFWKFFGMITSPFKNILKYLSMVKCESDRPFEFESCRSPPSGDP